MLWRQRLLQLEFEVLHAAVVACTPHMLIFHVQPSMDAAVLSRTRFVFSTLQDRRSGKRAT